MGLPKGIEFEGAVVRQELGITPNPTSGDKSTSLTRFPLSMVVAGEGIFAAMWSTGEETDQQLSPRLRGLAKATLKAYLKHVRAKRSSEGKDYANAPVVVGPVAISPTGVEGRLFVSFRTSHLGGPDDQRVRSSTYIVDLNKRSLNRRDNTGDVLVAGRKDVDPKAKYTIIGKSNELNELIGKKRTRLATRLLTEGWQNLATIRPTYIDSFVDAGS